MQKKSFIQKFSTIFRPEILEFEADVARLKGNGFHCKGQEYIHYSRLHHSETAFYRFSGAQILVLVFFFCCLLLGFSLNWHFMLVVVVAVITILYFSDLLFNLFLIFRSFSKPEEIKINEEDIHNQQRVWPTYTIFCPLYKEAQVVPQFISAMQALDYPKDRLQIMLLLEADDTKTITEINKLGLPPYFEVQVIPHSLPKTKPKALNFGLTKAKGMYSVIYDAEDVPDILQLKKVVLAFERAAQNIICIQAKLNFYNPHQNILTRVFTAEYSTWFNLILVGLQSIHAPIPLGGTSNHFRTQDLHTLRGWDSFNVTEDADLGMRLVKRGYTTAIVDSETLEEANSSFSNWFGQRTRWIKGYIQTYFLHMRHPHHFIKHWRDPQVITFQLVIGGKVLSMLINPFMLFLTICYFAFRVHIGTFIESFFPSPILYMGVVSFIFGNFLYMYYYMIGCAKQKHYELVKYVFLVPLYWLAMSTAAWVAVYRFIAQPHHWSKTKHGLHLAKKAYA